MDIPVKTLLRLLQPDRPADVRAAAVLVLGELGVRTSAALGEVAARLDDPDPAVRANALQAVGRLKVEKALPALLERVTHGGEESRLAAEAAAQLGPGAVKALQGLMHRVAPGLRRYIAAALTTSGAAGAEAAGVAMLLDHDPQVAGAAAAAILVQIPALTSDRKESLADELIALASDRKHPLPPAAELPVVRLLAALNTPAAADVLWGRVLPSHPAEVRAAALQAVGGWVEKPGKDQWGKLFACAADPDFRVAAPALMVLQRLPVADKQLPDWVKLFAAPDVAARRLAVEKVGGRDTAAVAAGLMSQLGHPDKGLRDAARVRLVVLDAGRTALTDALLAAGTPDEAWQHARSAGAFARDLSDDLRVRIFKQACVYLEAADRRVDPLLSLFREADAGGLRDRLFDRAAALRKKKKYDEAMLYLRTAARDPSIGFPVRLELALCGLKTSAKAADVASRAGDPCLRHFADLLDQDAGLLAKEVEGAKWLDPDDLFYIGFHFTEQSGRGRGFGADVLRLVIKRAPKGETARSAKNKLKLAGFS
jgi:hypothetical protein